MFFRSNELTFRIKPTSLGGASQLWIYYRAKRKSIVNYERVRRKITCHATTGMTTIILRSGAATSRVTRTCVPLHRRTRPINNLPTTLPPIVTIYKSFDPSMEQFSFLFIGMRDTIFPSCPEWTTYRQSYAKTLFIQTSRKVSCYFRRSPESSGS